MQNLTARGRYVTLSGARKCANWALFSFFQFSDLVVNAVVVVHLQLLDPLHTAALHDVRRHLVGLLSLRLCLGLAGLKQMTIVKAHYKPPIVATHKTYTYEGSCVRNTVQLPLRGT